MAEAARQAAADSHASSAEGIWSDLGGIATVQMYLERRVPQSSRQRFRNPTKSLKDALRASGTEFIAATSSGNSPQLLVNELAEQISTGKLRSALICGCEALATFSQAEKHGQPLPNWGDDSLLSPVIEEPIPLPNSGAKEYPVTDQEERVGMDKPGVVYALFDQALRRSRNLSLDVHLSEVGDIFSSFSGVASTDQAQHAWFPTFRTPGELCAPTPSNRMVCFPYTKQLNAIMDVDMSAGATPPPPFLLLLLLFLLFLLLLLLLLLPPPRRVLRRRRELGV
jgi:acetyl-CoA C-acetyltransferase